MGDLLSGTKLSDSQSWVFPTRALLLLSENSAPLGLRAFLALDINVRHCMGDFLVHVVTCLQDACLCSAFVHRSTFIQ